MCSISARLHPLQDRAKGTIMPRNSILSSDLGFPEERLTAGERRDSEESIFSVH